MPLMEWNQELSVGVNLLDQDHKKLVQLINDLYDAMKAGHSKDSLGAILDGLVNYTKLHFAHEEQYFAQANYPDSAAHKKEHDDLTKQVLEIQAQYRQGATGALSLKVMNFLRHWLVDHIQGCDKKYGPHLNSKGIH
jgi:hemerythrin